MNGKVHGSAGILISSSLLIFHPPSSFVVATAGIVGGALFAILADIDHGSSSISNTPGMNLLSKFITIFFRHRGFTHSLVVTALLCWCLVSQGYKPILIQIWIACYLSHIFLDMFNLEGVQLFWPLPYHVALLPNVLAVSSQPYSIVQNILFAVFQLIGSVMALHVYMTLFLNVESLKFLGEIWFKYALPFIPFI